MDHPIRQDLIEAIFFEQPDPDNLVPAQEEMKEGNLHNPMDTVRDGEELIGYLRRQGEYSHLEGTPLAGLIILDLNMPKMDRREALEEIDQILC